MFRFLGFGIIVWIVMSVSGAALAQTRPLNILIVGDSMLATNQISGRSVGHLLPTAIRARVLDRSVLGASYLYPLPITGALGLNIAQQMPSGSYDWVIMNGGGNDLLFGCGCGPCTQILNRLVSASGASGLARDTALRARATGAQVIYLGYLRTPGFASPVEHCAAAGEEYERRLARMAARYEGVTFIPLSDIVPYGDTSFHSADALHPSPKGSAAIASRVATAIVNNGRY